MFNSYVSLLEGICPAFGIQMSQYVCELTLMSRTLRGFQVFPDPLEAALPKSRLYTIHRYLCTKDM